MTLNFNQCLGTRFMVEGMRLLNSVYLATIVMLIIISSLVSACHKQAASARHFMVVTPQHEATDVGVKILNAGGNAIDAAVAIGYALAVVEPCCGNIGGGGFMVIYWHTGQAYFLDFRERAPLQVQSPSFLTQHGKVDLEKTLSGMTSSAVYGTVMGLETARARFGKLSRLQDITPAIALASNGFVLQSLDVQRIHQKQHSFSSAARNIFMPQGKSLHVGDVLKQPALAKTLTRLAEEGTQPFYQGDIADAVVFASQQQHGLLSKHDFASYTVKWREPVSCDYHGKTIIAAALPSAGGIAVCEALQLLSHFSIAEYPSHSARTVHILTEIMRRVFADRSLLGDSDFNTDLTSHLLSAQHTDELRKTIATDHATPAEDAKHYNVESYDTTHYSVLDAEGNAVAVTYTLNGFFGNGIIVPNTGFFLNNAMDDFSYNAATPNQFGLVQGTANLVQGGKRPLSSMSPTIVTDHGNVLMVLGAPGGPRIITQILQVMINVIDYHMDLQAAVNLPHFHHQWQPDIIFAEQGALLATVINRLQRMGHHITIQDDWGGVEAILQVLQPSKILYGVSDRRRPTGKAQGG